MAKVGSSHGGIMVFGGYLGMSVPALRAARPLRVWCIMRDYAVRRVPPPLPVVKVVKQSGALGPCLRQPHGFVQCVFNRSAHADNQHWDSGKRQFAKRQKHVVKTVVRSFGVIQGYDKCLV